MTKVRLQVSIAGFVFLLMPLLLAEPCASLQHFEWLLGEWICSNERNVTSETWKKVSEKTIEGTGKTRSKSQDKPQSFETLRIVEMSGAIYYIAKVAHNPLPVSFRLTSCSDSLSVFENETHDFPTKITYQRFGDTRMKVTVGNNMREFSLEFKKQE
ncbi:MAG: hypothetical protein DWQ05_00730 [Calditrichaeota bacterium]|nr:MAG: hypothetical protein DWQ05_00730 [Calditrichota bacterium]